MGGSTFVEGVWVSLPVRYSGQRRLGVQGVEAPAQKRILAILKFWALHGFNLKKNRRNDTIVRTLRFLFFLEKKNYF